MYRLSLTGRYFMRLVASTSETQNALRKLQRVERLVEVLNLRRRMRHNRAHGGHRERIA